LRIRFDQYSLDVVVLEDTDEDEVREMFLRLQNGTSLKAQEKRNAMPGKMREFVKSLTSLPFFQRVGFANARFTHDHVAAQMVCLEMAGGPTNVKDGDLNGLYKDNTEFDLSGKVAKAVQKTLNYLADVFPDKTPELERYNAIALYCVVAELQRVYAIVDIKDQLRSWFLDFETKRREQEGLDTESAEAEWVAYKEKISHSTDAQESIRFRMDFMLRDLLTKFSNLTLKDNLRGFTHIQKLTIFRRDHQICQLRLKCNGVKVEWDNWHCDHKVPWSKGGMTTVENGQVACPQCNLAKGSLFVEIET